MSHIQKILYMLHKLKVQKILRQSIIVSFYTLLLVQSCLVEVLANNPVHGEIFARGVVTNNNGQPFWAEFDEQGEVIEGSLFVAAGNFDVSKVMVLSRTDIQSYNTLYNRLISENTSNPPLLKTIEQYNNITFTNLQQQNINPGVVLGSHYVMIASPQIVDGNIYRYNQPESQILLARFPIDPSSPPSDDIKSLIINVNNGEILKSTENTLGFSTAFFTDIDGNVQSNDYFYTPSKHQLVNPVSNAIMEMAFSQTTSGYDGKYVVFAPFMTCNVALSSSGAPVIAQMSFQSFNPNFTHGTNPYYLIKNVPWPCQNVNFFHVGFGLGLWFLSDVQYSPRQYNNIKVDFAVLNGRAKLVNQLPSSASPASWNYANVDITTGPATTYGTSDYVADRVDVIAKSASSYDFDRDGIADAVYIGRVDTDATTDDKFFNTNKDNIPPAEWVQGVYLSSLATSPANGDLPDITRQMDTTVSLAHEGLVTAISEEDLKNTDVYFFRQATGELMAERTGSTLVLSKSTNQGVSVKDGKFNYTLHMRGKKQGQLRKYGFSNNRYDADGNAVTADQAFSSWQSYSGINPKFHERETDLLRPGELIKIVAINRATGYIGTRLTVLDGNNDQKEELQTTVAMLSKMVADIDMRPPNLKVWAERQSQTKQGLTAGEVNVYSVGNEGAALQNDMSVNIYTEWYDADGSPLPEALGDFGYTGRVARVTGPNQVSVLNGIDATFDIRPGKHIEGIQVSGMSNTNDHIYIQVSGEPFSRNPSFASDAFKPAEQSVAEKFETQGVHDGIIKYRPDRYVPFLTQVWDEGQTLAAQLAYNAAKKENAELDIPQPEAAYVWLYRPEFQYSVYQFDVDAILRQQDDSSEYVYTQTTPVVSSADDLLQLMYSLHGSTQQALQGFSFDGNKDDQLIFALGETEINATLGASQDIFFENLDELSSLTSDDFLTMRLYSNNDVENVLWEWAFTTLDSDIDSDNNNGLDKPDRSPAEEDIEALANYSGKIINVNNGDVNNNNVPDFAEFVYVDSNNQPVDMRFVPFIIEIPPEANLATATLRLSYAGSDPQAVTEENIGSDENPEIVYTPAEGNQRIWITNADKRRNPLGVQSGGDYITPEYTYKVSDLGYHRSNLIQVFYIEGIQKTETGAAQIRMVLEYN